MLPKEYELMLNLVHDNPDDDMSEGLDGKSPRLANLNITSMAVSDLIDYVADALYNGR
jgi:hypothetical protein